MEMSLLLGFVTLVVTIILVATTLLHFRGGKRERLEQQSGGAAAVSPAPLAGPDRSAATPAVTPLPRKRSDEMICTAGAMRGEIFRLDEKGIVIGRDARQAEVVIDDQRVSKVHVWVGIIDGRAFAVDRGSTNGTWLNRMDAPPIEKIVLQPGDTLIVGDDVARFRYHRGEGA